MRNRPVDRDEVRFNGRAITTAPLDAVAGPYDWAVPTKRLAPSFAPLWEPLTAMLGVPMPGSWELREAGPCHQCGRRYWQNYRSRGFFCSDHCANLARRARYAVTHGARRAMARAGRVCAWCGKPIRAARSTKRHCCSAHRVAAYRAGVL
jgi:hypothetical protein